MTVLETAKQEIGSLARIIGTFWASLVGKAKDVS
jgi:hypothetical protein